MSDQYETPLTSQPDWHGSYSYLPQNDSSVFPHSFQQNHAASSEVPRRQLGAGDREDHLPAQEKRETPYLQRRDIDPVGLRQLGHSSPILESPDPRMGGYATKAPESIHDDTTASTSTPGLSMGSNTYSSISSACPNPKMYSGGHGRDDEVSGVQKEEDEEMEDEDIIEGEGEASAQLQTTAERMAARRKMKRFRLTHQQTRFLTSEFAKQPHPDAAHRERLSREIPGLSPRQVQVWFQNRRAKIKRLTADDRDRMIKMRAVPDDFDNVQALHSPYGAVHGLGMPMGSPVEFSNPPYGNQSMRPLMVDVRRQGGDDHMSPTGLTPSFGGIGVNQGGGVGNSDMLSPMSPASSDRYPYPYGNYISSSLSGGPRRPSLLAGRQNASDAGMQVNRQNVRPGQPTHLRDPNAPHRSDSMPSSLRTSMSWKTDSMGYSVYHGENTNSAETERNQPAYQSGHLGQVNSGGLGGYGPNSYSGNTHPHMEAIGEAHTHEYVATGATAHSPTEMSYPRVQHASPPHRSRGRALSATLPLSVDIRNQYRQPGVASRSPTQSGNTTAPASSSRYSTSSIYTTAYPPAPLTAPLSLSPSRPSSARANVHDYTTSQMSAPITAPSDFSQALHTSQSDHTRPEGGRGVLGSDGSLGYDEDQERKENGGDDTNSHGSGRRGQNFTLPGGHAAGPGQ